MIGRSNCYKNLTTWELHVLTIGGAKPHNLLQTQTVGISHYFPLSTPLFRVLLLKSNKLLDSCSGFVRKSKIIRRQLNPFKTVSSPLATPPRSCLSTFFIIWISVYNTANYKYLYLCCESWIIFNFNNRYLNLDMTWDPRRRKMFPVSPV